MTAEEKLTGAGRLILLGVVGVVALIVFELVRGLNSTPIDIGLPPISMLAGLLCVASLPVILLSLGRSAAIIWISLVIAVLMTLFHGMHIFEHVGAGDVEMSLLIAITMFAPNAAAAWLIWGARKAE